MIEDDVQLILKEQKSNVFYEIPPDIYSNKDNSEAVYTNGDHKGNLQIQNDDSSMKTEPILSRFGGNF